MGYPNWVTTCSRNVVAVAIPTKRRLSKLRFNSQARKTRSSRTVIKSERGRPIDTPTASAKHTLRALARRWMALTEEIAIHDQHLARLTTETSPTLREGFGVGAHTAASC